MFNILERYFEQRNAEINNFNRAAKEEGSLTESVKEPLAAGIFMLESFRASTAGTYDSGWPNHYLEGSKNRNELRSLTLNVYCANIKTKTCSPA